mmetsp:Transcript_50934/g.99875  ORF Transcript_50934/g.99875 Transcript_50934/m.99875 type:complete len:261 (+) Transcript_50934:20-802(+)
MVNPTHVPRPANAPQMQNASEEQITASVLMVVSLLLVGRLAKRKRFVMATFVLATPLCSQVLATQFGLQKQWVSLVSSVAPPLHKLPALGFATMFLWSVMISLSTNVMDSVWTRLLVMGPLIVGALYLQQNDHQYADVAMLALWSLLHGTAQGRFHKRASIISKFFAVVTTILPMMFFTGMFPQDYYGFDMSKEADRLAKFLRDIKVVPSAYSCAVWGLSNTHIIFALGSCFVICCGFRLTPGDGTDPKSGAEAKAKKDQ